MLVLVLAKQPIKKNQIKRLFLFDEFIQCLTQANPLVMKYDPKKEKNFTFKICPLLLTNIMMGFNIV